MGAASVGALRRRCHSAPRPLAHAANTDLHGVLPGAILLGDPIDFGRGQTRGHGSQHRQHVSCPNWKHKSCKGLAIHSDPRARRTQTRPLAHLPARAQKKLVRHAADTATPTSFPSRAKKRTLRFFTHGNVPRAPIPLGHSMLYSCQATSNKNVRLFRSRNLSPTGLADVNIERTGCGVQHTCGVSRGHVFFARDGYQTHRRIVGPKASP